MPTLSAHARRVEKLHGLQGQHIRPDERLQNVQDARVQQKALAGGVPAVQLMHPREPLHQLLFRRLRRRRLLTGNVDLALEHGHDVRCEFFHFSQIDQALDD